VPGDRIPLIPAHMFKTYADVQVTPALSVDLQSLIAISGILRAGQRETTVTASRRRLLSHRPRPDRRLRPSSISGGRYRVDPRLVQVFAQVTQRVE
jgi:hypothetical protein